MSDLGRILEALERIERLLERQSEQPAVLQPIFRPLEMPYDPARCGMCGGHHGGALCPRLLPTAALSQ